MEIYSSHIKVTNRSNVTRELVILGLQLRPWPTGSSLPQQMPLVPVYWFALFLVGHRTKQLGPGGRRPIPHCNCIETKCFCFPDVNQIPYPCRCRIDLYGGPRFASITGRTQDFRRGGGCRDLPNKLTSQTSARLS